MVETADVVVIGAGLVGLATAYELAGRDVATLVVERDRIGAGASSAGAGLLAPISDWESAEPFLGICRDARDLWRPWLAAVVAESGLEVESDRSGCLMVELDTDDERLLDREIDYADRAGESWEPLPLSEARLRIPALAPAVRRVVLLHGEHRIDNVAACAALATACRRRGVTIREGVAVERVEVAANRVALATSRGDRIEATAAVLAAGAWSGGIAGAPPLPVRPVRGQMIRLGGAPWPFLGSVRGANGYAVRRGASSLLVGATVEEAGFDAVTTAAGIRSLLSFAAELFPGLDPAPLEASWAGLRPGSPDGRPLLGRLDGGPLVAACGHFRNGILLAPWTGIEIARHLADGTPISGGDLFAPDRFSRAAASPE
ncbi:MAG: glycine oxidase ThiO [Thermoanaerobaculia bacterium]